jgi:ATP-dependent RNA helicase DDX1
VPWNFAGLCRCGWSTVGASHDLGTDKQGFGFGGTGKKSHARQFDTFGEPYGKNDVLGCCVDLDTNQISYTRNGVDLGVAFTIQKQLHGQAFYAATTLKNAELQFNFGDTPFKHPPTGVYAEFTGLAHAKPDERAVKAAASAASGKGRTPMAVIIEPSRELAEQTFAQIELFRKNLPSPGVQAVALIGGGDTKEQIRQLQAGTDIVVGTPGRISDFLSTGKLDVSQVWTCLACHPTHHIRTESRVLLVACFCHFFSQTCTPSPHLFSLSVTHPQNGMDHLPRSGFTFWTRPMAC